MYYFIIIISVTIPTPIKGCLITTICYNIIQNIESLPILSLPVCLSVSLSPSTLSLSFTLLARSLSFSPPLSYSLSRKWGPKWAIKIEPQGKISNFSLSGRYSCVDWGQIKGGQRIAMLEEAVWRRFEGLEEKTRPKTDIHILHLIKKKLPCEILTSPFMNT